MRRIAGFDAERLPRQGRLFKVTARGTDHQGQVTLRGQARDQIVQISDQADAADGRRGQDALAVGFVVQRHVARHDGKVQRAAGLSDALDGTDQLAHDLGLFGVAEVQVVGRGQGQGAHRGQVAIGLGHGLLAALERVRLDISRGDVTGEGQRLAGSVHANDARAHAGTADRVGPDLRVVLFPDPGTVRMVRAADKRAQAGDGRDRGQGWRGRGRRRLDPGAVIFRRAGGQLGQRQVGHDHIAMNDQEAVLGDGLSDDGEVQVPFLEDRPRLGLLLGLQHHQHPLLGFRQHHLVGGHVGFALGHAVQDQLDPQAALVAHLDRRTGQARGPHVLDRDHRARRHQLKARFQQAFLGERIADLHGGTLVLDRVIELGAGHGRAADAVAPGLGAQIDDGHADARGRRIEDLVGIRQARRKRVDQAVAVIAGVETDLSADVRHAEGVAIGADPLDHALDQMRGLGVIGAPEGQRVHRRDRARAHGEDVTQDAAHAGRRALMGFDIAGMVVALHLEDHRLTVADIDHARVLSGTADHLGAIDGQGTQPFLGRLVGTVLVPHGAEDAQFGEGRFAPDDLQDAGILVRLQPVGRDQFRGKLWFLHDTTLPAHEITRLLGAGGVHGKAAEPGRGTKKSRAQGPA